MSTLTELDHAYVVLIESRLDSIERNLMNSGVGRRERQDIVAGVERQVHELLEAHPGKLTRDAVLQVLGSLAPPESYCSLPTGPRPVRQAQFAAPGPREPRPAFPAPASGGPVVAAQLQPGRPQPPQQCMSPECGARKTSSFAFAALVLALLSIPTVILFPIGAILALAGAICGGVAWHQIQRTGGRLGGKGMAVFSFVVFGIYVCLTCVILVSM